MEPCYKSTPKDYIYLWSLGVFCMQNKNSKDYKERGIFMIKVELKDGSIIEVEEGKSILDVAKQISQGLARMAMVGKVDG